jgi:hypothetical protein
MATEIGKRLSLPLKPQPLDHSKDDFRLWRFIHHDKSSPGAVELEMTVHLIKTCPDYNALSYVW